MKAARFPAVSLSLAQNFRCRGRALDSGEQVDVVGRPQLDGDF